MPRNGADKATSRMLATTSLQRFHPSEKNACFDPLLPPIPLPPCSGQFPCHPGQLYQGPLRTHCQLHTCTPAKDKFYTTKKTPSSNSSFLFFAGRKTSSFLLFVGPHDGVQVCHLRGYPEASSQPKHQNTTACFAKWRWRYHPLGWESNCNHIEKQFGAISTQGKHGKIVRHNENAKKMPWKGTTLGIKVPESKMFWPAIKLPRALFPAPVIPNIIT